ncbi:hypothetical protein [Pseudorhizobium marinum]|uniref:hypothetical protein n=1 Tax=Pseudorhizobium marinum TaxID=1496690 RepID=UPI0004971FCB|nr:hypothetical protein [Pseudorhizobium marinum]
MMASRSPSLAVKTRLKLAAKPRGSELAADIRRRLELFEAKVGVSRRDTSEIWDRPMDQADVFKTSPSDKGKRTLVSVMRKVGLLIDMIDDQPLRADISRDYYKDRTALRGWMDASRGLWPWKDPLIDKPDGRYGELIALYFESLAAVEAADKGKNFKLRERLDEQSRVIIELERQNLELLNRIYKLLASMGKSDAKR